LQLDESRRARISDPAYFFREDDPRLEGLTKEETLAILREQGSEEAKEAQGVTTEVPEVSDVPESAEQVIEYQTDTMTNKQKIEQNEELKKEMGSEYDQKVDEGETYPQWFERRKEYYINWMKKKEIKTIAPSPAPAPTPPAGLDVAATHEQHLAFSKKYRVVNVPNHLMTPQNLEGGDYNTTGLIQLADEDGNKSWFHLTTAPTHSKRGASSAFYQQAIDNIRQGKAPGRGVTIKKLDPQFQGDPKSYWEEL